MEWEYIPCWRGKRITRKSRRRCWIGSQVWDLTARFSAHFEEGICLYGEGYGGKIQKAGSTYGPQQKFVLFDVKIGDLWLQRGDVHDIANKMGLEVVPIRGMGSLDSMVAVAEAGIHSSWGDFLAEGLVARPEIEMRTRRGDRMITKIKTKDFI